MSASYSPKVSSASGVSMSFQGETAADVVEQILKSSLMRERLGLNGLAGYYLHGLELGKASHDGRSLGRDLTIQWQAMQTVQQAQAGQHNPIEARHVRLERGTDDAPDVEWVWVMEGGKLNAQAR